MSDTAWLESLKVGDSVAAWNGWSHSIATVTHVTKTRVRVGTVGEFRKKNGTIIGGGAWSRWSISPVTQEIRDEIEHAELVSICSGFGRNDFKAMPTETLRKLAKILKQAKKVTT